MARPLDPSHAAETKPLCEELRRLGRRAADFDTRPFERATPEEVRAALVPDTISLVSAAADALGRVLDWCDERLEAHEGMDPGPSPSAAERAIDRLMEGLPDVSSVSDLAFVARLDLRQKQLELQGISEGGTGADNVLRVVGACASVRRRVLKTLAATEQSLAELIGEPSGLRQHFATQLETSLRVRGVYRVLLRTVGAPDEHATVPKLLAVLAAIGNELVALVADPIWQDLRIEDRVALTSLQERLEAWLRAPEDARAGLHLWQDVSAVAGALQLVNNRAVLRDHDLLVARSLASLVEGAGDAPVSDEVLARCRALAGRDEALDALLAAQPPPTCAALAVRLHEIETALVPRPPNGGRDPLSDVP